MVAFEDRPFKEQLKDKRWLTEVIKGVTNYSKLQEAFKEIARYIKTNRNELNEKKLVFYDEIETLRIKYEHGKGAARKYQQR